MMELSDAIACAGLLSTPGVGQMRVRAALDWSVEHHVSLAELVDTPTLRRAALGDERAERVSTSRGTAESAVMSLHDKGFVFCVLGDPDYPSLLRSRLRERAPVMLTMRGNVDLIDKQAVSFCGSRKATEVGRGNARRFAELLVNEDVNVVSGYAAGIDSEVHYSALASAGATTIVIPEGALRFYVKRYLRPVWDWDRALVISEFSPNAGWNVGAAMQRNKTICGLSSAMILIEARTKGGSFNAGLTCLELDVPLFAASYDSDHAAYRGNRVLIERGAREIKTFSAYDRPGLAGIMDTLNSNVPLRRIAEERQLYMFGESNESA